MTIKNTAEHSDALRFEQEPTVTICDVASVLRTLIEHDCTLGGVRSDRPDTLTITLPSGDVFNIMVTREPMRR